MEIKKVGVVGCGLMGAGIAQVAAQAGYETVVREINDELLEKGLGRISAFLDKGVAKKKMTQVGRNIEIIRGLPLSDETKDKIIGGNAARILGLGCGQALG